MNKIGKHKLVGIYLKHSKKKITCSNKMNLFWIKILLIKSTTSSFYYVSSYVYKINHRDNCFNSV